MTRDLRLSKWPVENVQVVLVVVLAMNLASLKRKADAKLLSGPSKSGRASITPPMKVSLGCNVIKIRATKHSSPSYGVSPVESTRLESKDKKFRKCLDPRDIEPMDKQRYRSRKQQPAQGFNGLPQSGSG